MLPSMGRRHPLLSPLPGKPSSEDEEPPNIPGASSSEVRLPVQGVLWSLNPSP